MVLGPSTDTSRRGRFPVCTRLRTLARLQQISVRPRGASPMQEFLCRRSRPQAPPAPILRYAELTETKEWKTSSTPRKLVRAMISTRKEDADPVGSATLLAARFTPLKNVDQSRLRAFPCEPLLVMRGGRAPSDPRPDPRRGNGPVRPSPLRLHFSSILAVNPDWLAAGALRLFGEKASVSGLNPRPGGSAITSDDVDLSRATRPHRVRGSGCDVTKMVNHTIRAFAAGFGDPAVPLRARLLIEGSQVGSPARITNYFRDLRAIFGLP